MNLKEFASIIHSDEKIVILEAEGYTLKETKVFKDDFDFFNDSIENEKYPESFYQRPVRWFSRKEKNNESYYIVRIGQ